MPCLSVGQFVKLYCDWLSKPKYFLVVGADDEPLLFFISTEKPWFCSGDPPPPVDFDFLKLTKAEHSFLDYDSWLDCGDVCRKFTWQSIEYQLRQNLGRHCGHISEATTAMVIDRVGASERLSTKHQMAIAAAFSN